MLEGDTVSARGTTLGGDDGIAVAMAMAILDDDSLSHPAIEAIFTVDEETGMYGAEAWTCPFSKPPDAEHGLRGRGHFHRQLCRRRPGRLLPARDPQCLQRPGAGDLRHRPGGRSLRRRDRQSEANSSMLLGRVLCALEEKTDLRVISVCGGLKDNAIPTGSVALVAADAAAAQAVCAEMDAAFKRNTGSTTRPSPSPSARRKPTCCPWMKAPAAAWCVCSPACPTASRP